jgi:hypothetical protein
MSPLMKAEFEEWGTKTTVGVLAGMMYGGLREAAASAVNSISSRVLLISRLCCIPSVVLVVYGHFQLH